MGDPHCCLMNIKADDASKEREGKRGVLLFLLYAFPRVQRRAERGGKEVWCVAVVKLKAPGLARLNVTTACEWASCCGAFVYSFDDTS